MTLKAVQLLSLWALTLATGFATNDAREVGEDVVGDQLFMEPLDQLQRNVLADRVPGLDARIELALQRCRAHATSPANDESRIGDYADEPTPCKNARYARYMRQRQRAVWRRVEQVEQARSATASDDKNARAPVTVQVQKELPDLQTFFSAFAAKGVPALVPSTLEAELTDEFLRTCFVTASSTLSSPLRVQDEACMSLLENFQVPLFMVHDYVRRTDSSANEEFLPALLTPGSNAAQQVASCPYGLHMLLSVVAGVEDAISGVKLLPSSFLSLMQAKEASEYTEIALSGDASAALSDSNAWWGGAVLRQLDTFASFHADLAPKTLLFVPGAYFARIAAPSDVKILRFCYLDASNLNTVKERLRMEALVDKRADELLTSLQSVAFDTTMFRRPATTDTLWKNFVTWPKEVKIVKKSDLLSTEAGNEKLQLSRRERLKLWQDDKRWDRHIQALTLPVSMAPVIVNTTRNTATIKWQDIYHAPKHDITGYGYEVRWSKEDGVENASAAHASGEDELATNEYSLNISHKALVRSALPTSLFGDEFDGKDIQAVVTGLDPDSVYSFTVRVFVGESFGLPSDRSRSIRTLPCSLPSRVRGVPLVEPAKTICVHVRWVDPADDGGKPIEWYIIDVTDADDGNVLERHLATQVAADTSSYSWRRILINAQTDATSEDAWRRAQVCNLLPAQAYQIRVAAANLVGVGKFSAWSDVFVIPAQAPKPPGDIPTLTGAGAGQSVFDNLRAPGADNVPSVLKPLLSASTAVVPSGAVTVQRPVAELSDIKQKLAVSNTSEEFDVWSSHYSPHLFHVAAEIAVADPIDASSALVNADAVRNRIVLVARGGIPFVFKVLFAQQAGALGVVIGDFNGTCAGRFDQRCVPGADRSRGEGFAAQDQHPMWHSVRIPVVLALQDTAQRLLRMAQSP